MSDATASTDPFSQDSPLEHEASGRLRFGWAGIAGAIALLGSTIITQIVQAGGPSVLLSDALRDSVGERFGNPPSTGGLLDQRLEYLDGRFGLMLLETLLQAIYTVGLVLVLLFLFEAASARRPEVQRWLRSVLLTGGAAIVIGLFIEVIGQHLSITDYLDGARSSQGARDAYQPPVISIALQFFGSLALALGWVILALHAMRAGLLTRFLGVLGIICGVLTIPIFAVLLSTLSIVQIFWLLFVGVLLIGRAPSGTPPAWVTGKAEPWPSAADARAAADQAKQADEVQRELTGTPSPATSSRKRKRRG